MKKALSIGITGQDGSYLAEFLQEKGYTVFRMVRRSSFQRFERLKHALDKLQLMAGDLTEQSSPDDAIKTIGLDEICNLASQVFVPTSWNQPVLTAEVTGIGVTRILKAIRKHKPDTKFYQASSREMFRRVQETPQREKTPVLSAKSIRRRPMRTGSRSIIGKATTSSPAQGSASIRSLRGEGWSLERARSPTE